VLHDELADAGAGERPLAGEQPLVDDGQAVLVAEAGDVPVEGLRAGVDGRDAAGDGGLHALQVLDQAEVGHLDVGVDEEEVLRLDVQVLQLVLLVHQVEGLGGLLHVAEELVAGDAGHAAGAALLVAVPEVVVGQLHDDDEQAVDDVVAFQREDVGVADGLDAREGLELLLGAVAVVAGGAEVAEDELDGLVQAAGGLALPDLAKAAAADPLQEAVAGDRFGVVFDPHRHEYTTQGAPPHARGSSAAWRGHGCQARHEGRPPERGSRTGAGPDCGRRPGGSPVRGRACWKHSLSVARSQIRK
jgi:hypothetical protein